MYVYMHAHRPMPLIHTRMWLKVKSEYQWWQGSIKQCVWPEKLFTLNFLVIDQ